jgi:hypothetical protein
LYKEQSDKDGPFVSLSPEHKPFVPFAANPSTQAASRGQTKNFNKRTAQLLNSAIQNLVHTLYLQEQSFKDGAFFYRFLEDEPFVKSAANWSGATSDSEPPPAVDLGNGLRKLILAVYDEFLSDDGRHVDYQGIAKSEIFRRCGFET